jgi:cytochrome P450
MKRCGWRHVRRAPERIVLDDLVIPAGAMFWMCRAAGNRDPNAFPEPTAFRPSQGNRGLPFGIGAHACGHGRTKQLAPLSWRALPKASAG